MPVTLEKKEKNIVEFKFEISEEAFEEGKKKAFLKNVKYFNIPGFRKGKAPRSLVEKMYGEDILYEDAINFACPDAYDNAVEVLGLEPVDRPEIDVESIEKGKPVVIKAKVTVKPEVVLGKYKGIEIENIENNVSAEDIDAEISGMREKNARIITVDDRAVTDGDIANIDFEGFKDGVAFDGGKGDNFDLTIGSGQFIPGFEEQLIGMSIGDKKTIEVTFPDDYQAEDLKGAAVTFDVTINGISKKELPELDDEFAKDVSEFDTFDEFKADIEAKLKKNADDRTKSDTEAAVLSAASKEMTVDIPECMIESQLDSFVRDYDMRLSQQGLNIDKYLEIMGMNMEQFKNGFKSKAEEHVRVRLMLEAVAKEEKLEASAEEIEAEYTSLADEHKMEAEAIKKYLPESEIKNDIINKKVVELLIENCKKKKAAKKAAPKKTTKKAQQADSSDNAEEQK